MLQAMFRLSDYPVKKVQDGQPCTPHHSYHIHSQTPRALATTVYRTYTLLPREVQPVNLVFLPLTTVAKTTELPRSPRALPHAYPVA